VPASMQLVRLLHLLLMLRSYDLDLLFTWQRCDLVLDVDGIPFVGVSWE
jgi:hypothetical protein